MRAPTIAALAFALLTPPLLLAEEVEEEFDPRRPPDTKLVEKELKLVRRSWKSAGLDRKKELLTSLEIFDHPRTPPLIVTLVERADEETCAHALGVLGTLRAAFVAPVLPRLLDKRDDDQELWLAIVELAIDKKCRELLPALRKMAAKNVWQATEEELTEELLHRRDRDASRRRRSIQALGLIPHEGSLETLVSIMESYANLEDERVPHGAAGSNPAYPRFYVPARHSFILITGAQIESGAQARRWLTEHPGFAVERQPREGDEYLRGGKRKGRKER